MEQLSAWKKIPNNIKMTFSISSKPHSVARNLFLENNLFNNLLGPQENTYLATACGLLANDTNKM